jgi:peptide/nickel transport system ATP-binding protein
MAPSLSDLPRGCAFRDRCARAKPDCARAPTMRTLAAPGHAVRCHHPL